MFFNVSGAQTQALLSPGDGVSNAKVIHITNNHASDGVEVDLFFMKLSSSGSAATTAYILNSNVIAVKTYLNIESEILSFNNSQDDGLGLYIKLNNADSNVDVIIK